MGEELDAICDGKLDTVVDARGSAEFVGLSTGINATVDRLKELIAEAKKRIEQELEFARSTCDINQVCFAFYSTSNTTYSI